MYIIIYIYRVGVKQQSLTLRFTGLYFNLARTLTFSSLSHNPDFS